MSPKTNIVRFTHAQLDPQNIDLRSIKPANKNFDKMMSYRSQRLIATTYTRSSQDTAEAQVHIKMLKLTLKYHVFHRNYPINRFDFLARFVNKADMLNMSKAQAFISFPTLMAGKDDTRFRTNVIGTSRYFGITCWAEAILYLLRTYAATSAVLEVLDDLHKVMQKVDPKEDQYTKCFNQAIFGCGNIH